MSRMPSVPGELGGLGEQGWRRADRLAARLWGIEDEGDEGRESRRLYRRLAARMLSIMKLVLICVRCC